MKDEDTNKDFFFSLSLSFRSLLFFLLLLLLLLKFFSSSIRMMWTMKCFSRETDRELLSDFIRLGQTWWSIISSHQLFCSLSLFSLFFFRQPTVVSSPQKTWKKGKKGNQEKVVRHVKRVALIKLYPFYNTISNTYTHEVVVLWFE